MYKDYFGYRRWKKDIPKVLLLEWIKVNINIVEHWNGKDVPWWCNERASLSVFAGAVWKAGGIAFEEFVDDKKNPKIGRLYKGRVDIYFMLYGNEFIGEAKPCWSGASIPSRNLSKKIISDLKKACKDVRMSKPIKQRRLGILFATPRIKETSIKNVDDRIDNWIESIKNVDCSCVAWVFPKKVRELLADDGYLYPGAAVLIKEV